MKDTINHKNNSVSSTQKTPTAVSVPPKIIEAEIQAPVSTSKLTVIIESHTYYNGKYAIAMLNSDNNITDSAYPEGNSRSVFIVPSSEKYKVIVTAPQGMSPGSAQKYVTIAPDAEYVMYFVFTDNSGM